MRLKFGMVMDNIDHININKDTSFAMLLEAQTHDWELHYMQLNDLFISQGKAYARTAIIQVKRDANRWYEIMTKQVIALDQLDSIIMRKDPPVNQDYLYATYILEQAEQAGVYIVNKPQSLRDANEKLYTLWFPECCTDSLVSSNAGHIRDFLAIHQDIILKPLDGMGGASIFRLQSNDPNIAVIIETMTHYGQKYLMAQKYLPAIQQGDKRILLINGEPIPYALARIPTKGETRGNLAAGGSHKGQPLSERDIWITQQIGPTLKAKGLIFVGIDIIGDYLTEINVTSPTCVQELERQFDLNICGQLITHIEDTLFNH